ncbi:hypothetical protein CEXT_44401 [Caerostris extrusa]|uniref:Uncharacterized protein n=1 Tax=Caerostris extrusa TaxID=172846 RepID=A0AAV4W233_CAEEX|nr:hypothetical protein CEXT_44401 [Caerostris extrusa]
MSDAIADASLSAVGDSGDWSMANQVVGHQATVGGVARETNKKEKRECLGAIVRTHFFAVTVTSEFSAFPDSHWLPPLDIPPLPSETFIHELRCVKVGQEVKVGKVSGK